jgi:hypothetical protein
MEWETHSTALDTRHWAQPGSDYAFLWEASARPQLHRSTAEAAPGYDHEAVSYGIGDAQRTDRHTHGRRAAAEDTTRSMGKRSARPTLHRSTAEARI